MKKIDTEELKKIQVEILEFVDQFCEERNIKYSLYAGTLIGAVRHKGFIPWDDDIDIMMPRKDYEKFVKELHHANDSRYKILEFRYDNSYHYAFGKVIDSKTDLKEEVLDPYDGLGIYIDVFPIDVLPDSKFKINITYLIQWIFFNIKSFKQTPLSKNRNFIKNYIIALSHILFWPISIEKCLKIIIKNAQRYSDLQSNTCGDVVGGYGIKEVQSTSNFDDYIRMVFEGKKFLVSIGYHNYLTSVFGDYMKLPPVEKRVSTHRLTANWKE